MPPRSVDDDYLEALGFKLLNALSRDDDRVRFGVAAVKRHVSNRKFSSRHLPDAPSVKRHTGLYSVLLELVKSTCTEGIGTDEGRLETSPLIVDGQLWHRSSMIRSRREKEREKRTNLCTAGCLSAALQTDKHDNIRLAFLRLPHSIALTAGTGRRRSRGSRCWIYETDELIVQSLQIDKLLDR
jgi:hypothetical protein